MRKFVTFLLAFLLIVGLVGCSSGVSQEEYDEVVAENEELKQSLTEMRMLLLEYYDGNNSPVETKDIAFEGIARCFSENSICTILSDDLIQITIPQEGKTVEEIKGTIEEYVATIPIALQNSEFKSCLILVVDDDGVCLWGYTIKSDGSSSVFISEFI